jgi:NAD(P)-dependent dehydrogenase (short-subunit alcohol dehydrogenase family)/rhamnose utilization protein RhaD (predicted bifunctional aldolase and dehydrogenase)
MNMEEKLNVIAGLSRRYGADPDYVFLGGGNTSVKNDTWLYIKPSGAALATINAEQFLPLDRARLRQIFTETLPTDVSAREQMAKYYLEASVCPPGGGRPSVEAPLHEAIAYRYVVHLHPTLVNGMTCGKDGRAACQRLFPDALWIDYCDPGYTLAMRVKAALDTAEAASGKQPQVIFLQNHGVFVGADSDTEIIAIYDTILATLRQACEAAGAPVEAPVLGEEAPLAAVLASAPALRTLLGDVDRGERAIVRSLGLGSAFAGPLTPDHIVYAKSFAYNGDGSRASLDAFKAERGYLPKVLVLPEAGVFMAGATPAEAEGTRQALENALAVERLTAAFGGPRYLTTAEYSFIEHWEAESYRRQVSLAGQGGRRLAGKVCVVTGGAQGFGLGIAECLAAEGGVIVIADMNLEGAEKAAADLRQKHGKGAAVAVQVNIADEDSVAAMVGQVTRLFGGMDLLVANAGVLRAGSVKDITRKDWDFVTDINYTGYFLCVKHVARVMARQIVDGEGAWSDIVQVNSKSGLEGSNKNGAYAGSKFGTIGLTQSFAKELVEDRIKVNSVCPGNFYDGPLWSHPEKGLFVQYLATGKVPGATTVAEVRKFYEDKVPMRRGCFPADVARAILYCVEQAYETGQAIPVTGGQVMLH